MLLDRRNVYAVEDVARIFGVSTKTIYRWLATNVLPSMKVRGRVLVGRDAVDAMVAACNGKPSAPGVELDNMSADVGDNARAPLAHTMSAASSPYRGPGKGAR